MLGKMYCLGQGVERDMTRAKEWLQEPVKQKKVEALFYMGMVHMQDNTPEFDLEKARYYFLEAAEHDHVYAEYCLGLIYHYGMDVKRDSVEGRKWFQRSADGGYEEAKRQLELMDL